MKKTKQEKQAGGDQQKELFISSFWLCPDSCKLFLFYTNADEKEIWAYLTQRGRHGVARVAHWNLAAALTSLLAHVEIGPEINMSTDSTEWIIHKLKWQR